MRARHLRHLITLAAAAILTACGGGGGGSSPTTRAPLPQVVSDTNPVGDRIDLRSRNYFPAAAGDSWTYDYIQNGVTTSNLVTRTVGSTTADGYTISERVGSALPDTETYRRTAAGLVMTDITDDSTPAAARTLIGEILMYPEPFYPTGATRSVVRQGDWGADVDGDGINESFRLEIAQQLVGLENMTLPLGAAESAHFRTVTALTLSPSSLANKSYTVTATEDTWWAPGIGLVQADRTAVDSSSATVIAPYRLRIASGTVGGTTLFEPPPDGTVTKLTLTHNALVFDATRNRYYASIPGSVAGTGNSIATIDASTGAVSNSLAVGSEPFEMAISPDGSALYVGLNGSGEVVKLSLPGMTEQYRTRLPTSYFFGRQLQAKSITVSPAEADVIAVSLFDPTISPGNAGVALVRTGALQPLIAGALPAVGGQVGPIAFDGIGATVYGFNEETSEYGLYAMSVRGDGLSVANHTGITMTYYVRNLDWTNRGILVHRSIYRGSDLALLGTAPHGRCRPLSTANRLVCIATTDTGLATGRLATVDATTFATVATPAFSVASNPPLPSQLVPGADGQVAIRLGSDYRTQPATAIWLFNSPMLQ